MSFTPPKASHMMPITTTTPTTTAILSFKEFFGGGTISGAQIKAPSLPIFTHHPNFPIPFRAPKSLYRITWTDFERQLTSYFAELYGCTDSADLSIMCGVNQEMLRAHQQVVSLGSLYFREALKMVPSKHPTVVVRHLTGDSMKNILEYVYLGRIAFRTETELNNFFGEAKYLQVVGIQEGKYSLSR